jgi:tRNA-specific 2-thiouridylase
LVASHGRAFVAMSGGVDSSVAAALLVEQGFDVTGVMLRLWAEDENRCCSLRAVEDARAVAERFGIGFHLVDYEAEFQACVVHHFVAEYSRGRTPNPCLTCNRQIRFGRLLRHVQAMGADFMATGHYARITELDGVLGLQRGVDPYKDQSYVLYMLEQDQLQKLLFPVGSYTKAQVREMASRRNLPVADKDESMEICFVTDDDYRRFLREHAPQAVQPGPILSTSGEEIGRHQGLPCYTVGQRRGLGIAAPEALYVLRLDVVRNALIVGTKRELGRRTLLAEDVSYIAGEPPEGPVRVQAKIRYRALLADATWTPLDKGRARVAFDEPLRDITPGQAVVAYQDELVLGGGTISE